MPVIQAVSPNFHFKDGVLVDPSGAVRNKDDIATKIDIYEDRMRAWSLDWARELSKQHNAGFAVLTLALTYVEGVEQYRAGQTSRGRSEEFFKVGMGRLFPTVVEADLGALYVGARCGLFHDGITKKGIAVEPTAPSAIEVLPQHILINPTRLLDRIDSDFTTYLAELRNPANGTLRANFEKMWPW